MLAYKRPYGLGDAQIDAQNNVEHQMGEVLAAYNAVKNAGNLSVAYIGSVQAQIQGFIDNYASQYANSSRGEAGRKTLQTFFDTKVKPGFLADLKLQMAGTNTETVVVPPPSDANASPVSPAYDPNTNYAITVNTGGNAPATPGNIAPSQTPMTNSPEQPISIPGTVANVSAPDWLQNPLLWVGVGVGLLVLMSRSKNS